jgi:hypothetical protein
MSADLHLGDVMIIRSGLHCQQMEKRRGAFLSDDGGAFTAIPAASVETLTTLTPARRMAGMGHPEFGHVGAFAHPASFPHAMFSAVDSRSLRAAQSVSIQASVPHASLVDNPDAYTELPACPDRVESALSEHWPTAFNLMV